jgi:hypothetical protein
MQWRDSRSNNQSAGYCLFVAAYIAALVTGYRRPSGAIPAGKLPPEAISSA